MGGAVSSGRDNNELVDNLMSGNYIRSRAVERVFRVLDRADYMSAEARDQAYKDLAWRNGPLHLSAPCIYCEVMEALELRPGLSFLNVGSGTGYLSTLVGLIIGSSGISHGVEAIPVVFDYANKKLSQFIENSVTLDEFDYCMPKYYTGNGLCLAPTNTYDRVYCGAGVLSKYENYFKQFVTVGGVLVMPLADTLVQLRRVSRTHWTKRNLLNVSFALLRDPDKDELEDLVKLDELTPPSLQILSRAVIRDAMRAGLMRRHPELREPPPPPPPAPRTGPRRICIPYDAASDEEFNELHELDEAGGAHEMNALLSLVLSMGQNRAAGSLRLEPVEDDDERGDGEPAPAPAPPPASATPPAPAPPPRAPRRAVRDELVVLDVSAAGARPRRLRPSRPRDVARRACAGPSAPDGAPDAASTSWTVETFSDSEPHAAGGAAAPRSPRPPGRRAARPPRPPRDHWSDSSSADEDATQVQESKRQKLDSGIGEGTASSGASPDKSDSKATNTDSDKDDDSNDQDTDMPWCDENSSGSSCNPRHRYGGEHDSDDEDEDDDDDDGDEPEAEGPGAGGPAAKTELKWNLLDSGLDLDSGFGGGPDDGAARPHAATGRRRLQRRGRGRARAGASGAGGAEGGRASESDSGAEEGGGGRRAGAGRDHRRVRLSLAMKRGVKELPLPHALKKYVNYERCYQF